MSSWSIRDMAEYLARTWDADKWSAEIGTQDGGVVHALVEAVLAEHPADEDEPWDGPEVKLKTALGHDLRITRDVVEVQDTTYKYADLIDKPTKGQVACLLKALGVGKDTACSPRKNSET